ncbi:hypothetical protein ACFWR9_20750 [Streptomyces sp. NPDC058534]|uniref:hypothetical protein n=1 Tax=Streptomyces sp. NPDC058534 TaxID=3346541 RepID=UPI0036667281
MTDLPARPERAASSTRQARVAELLQLARADYASTAPHRQANPRWPATRADVRAAVAPSDLAVAIRTAQQVVDSDQVLTVREALHLLLHALGVEPDTTPPADEPPALRCPAATASDTSACGGPVVVLVLGLGEAGVSGCEHHAARLIAAAPGTYPVALPHAPEGTATRVFKAAGEAGRR